jgi:tetratricopeptide (TPR) repeat protein
MEFLTMQQPITYFKQRAIVFVSAFLLGLSMPTKAQIATTENLQGTTAAWNTQCALLFKNAQYEACLTVARQFWSQARKKSNTTRVAMEDEVSFYQIASMLALNDSNALSMANSFLQKHTTPYFIDKINYFLAQYHFRLDHFQLAIPLYEKASISNLNNEEIIDLKFELAYCYFNNKNFEKANSLFAVMKSLPGVYKDAANYYYGLIAYNKANYKEALSCFELIASSSVYGNTVPYYVAELYYFSNNKDKALNYALGKLNEKTKLYYDKELHKLVAQIYFEKNQYDRALPHFEYYYQHTDRIKKEELYELAYCNYYLDNWKEAIDYFKPLSNMQDSLGQTAMYLLGASYLKLNDKKNAKYAFDICSQFDFNASQTEASLYLSSKISYDLQHDQDAVTTIEALKNQFPSSAYTAELNLILGAILVKRKEFEPAIAVLQKALLTDAQTTMLLQEAYYGAGIAAYQKSDFASAATHFLASSKVAIESPYQVASLFWLLNANYKNADYNNALKAGNLFIEKNKLSNDAQQISDAATNDHAQLILGYVCLDANLFAEAQVYFKQAQLSKDNTIIKTASLKEADAYFLAKQYAKASILYDRIIQDNNEDSPYAIYQKAIILGLNNKASEKITLLKKLIDEKNEQSPFIKSARFELATTFYQQEQYGKAIEQFKILLDDATDKDAVSKVVYKIAAAYQQLDDTTNALLYHKRVLTQYPSSEEYAASLDAIKAIYMNHNQPALFIAFKNQLGNSDSSTHADDSLFYETALNLYAINNWDKALLSLNDFINRYPTSVLIPSANYYKAVCLSNLKQTKGAMESYRQALQAGLQDDLEATALNEVARLSFETNALDSALSYWATLRANYNNALYLKQSYLGMMKVHALQHTPALALSYADSALATNGLSNSEQHEISFYKGRCYVDLKQYDSALVYLTIAQKNTNGLNLVMANYYAALCWYQINKLGEAEKEANKTIAAAGANTYWIVKTYLLLADILVKQKDYFNAKATLQSIIKNAKFSDLKQEAQDKLLQVKVLESKNTKLKID